jgi:hypothetical protein
MLFSNRRFESFFCFLCAAERRILLAPSFVSLLFPFGKQSETIKNHGPPKGDNQALCPCMVTDASSNKNLVFVMQRVIMVSLLFPMRRQKAHIALAAFCFPFVSQRETIRNNQKQSSAKRLHEPVVFVIC